MSSRWESRNTTSQTSIGLIASKAKRKASSPEDPETLPELLERHRHTFINSFIFVTWGTYVDTFVRTSAPPEAHDSPSETLRVYESSKKWETRTDWSGMGYALRPGKRGGILEMAEHLEESAGTDRIDTLVFLSDPEDLEESYPEDITLFRAAMRNDIVYLPTFRTASLWAAYEADEQLRSGAERVVATAPEHETLALIAHDRKKLELCRWVVEHHQTIDRFKRIVTTGTTGEWVQRFLKASGVAERKIELVDRKASGPKGGDVEIAGEVLRGACEHVVFFVDPMTSHPHEADIQSLLRVCSMPNVVVNLRLTERTASTWIKVVKEPSL